MSAPPRVAAGPIPAKIVESVPAKIIEPGSDRPVLVREFVAITLMVVLADVSLYWGQGYAGIGAFLLLAPLIMLLGATRAEFKLGGIVSAVLLCLIVARVVWLGTPVRVMCGATLLLGVAASLSGARMDLRAILLLPVQAMPAGLLACGPYAQRLKSVFRFIPKGVLLSVGLPAIALVGFGTIFILANPDVVTIVSDRIQRWFDNFHEWLMNLTLRPTEVFFWVLVGLVFAGFLRPLVNLRRFQTARSVPDRRDEDDPSRPSALYPAVRNMFLAVIALFGAYLVFEFRTLWFREFPEGFYYAGYAHEGAFWLTVALASATVVLSIVFRGSMLRDPRIRLLRRLAWGWCLLNGLLAIAVYNRLFIYVDFNGLTHLRIVGMFGIAAVVAGLVLVVWKITLNRDFAWLISRQLWALAITVFLYAITPIDAIAVNYNARRILAGDSSATMQIGVKRIDTEGVLALPPLLNCDDPEIQRGVRALMADHYHRLTSTNSNRRKLGWTSRQLVDDYAIGQLERWRMHWIEFDDPTSRQAALRRFYDYAYQWY